MSVGLKPGQKKLFTLCNNVNLVNEMEMISEKQPEEVLQFELKIEMSTVYVMVTFYYPKVKFRLPTEILDEDFSFAE